MDIEAVKRLVEIDDNGCWLWLGSRRPDRKYGRIKIAGRDYSPHRVTYEMLVGPIPEGLVIDHLCKVTLCCNPEHLEPVTIRENSLRSAVSIAAVNASKTQCVNGHDFTEATTGYRADNGTRYCKVCHQERKRQARAAARAAARARA